MVDRGIECLEQPIGLFLLLEPLVGGNVREVNDLTFLVVEDKGHPIDDEGLV